MGTLQTVSLIRTRQHQCKSLWMDLTKNKSIEKLGHVKKDWAQSVTYAIKSSLEQISSVWIADILSVSIALLIIYGLTSSQEMLWNYLACKLTASKCLRLMRFNSSAQLRSSRNLTSYEKMSASVRIRSSNGAQGQAVSILSAEMDAAVNAECYVNVASQHASNVEKPITTLHAGKCLDQQDSSSITWVHRQQSVHYAESEYTSQMDAITWHVLVVKASSAGSAEEISRKTTIHTSTSNDSLAAMA